MINLRLAACAIALDRHRSFARAAVAVGVTQPTFSRSIAMLEADLGVRLFDRTSRRVEPTAAGHLLLSRARTMLADAERLRDELGDLRSLRSGELIVGVGPHPLVISVIEAIGRLVAKSPGIHVELIEAPWRDLVPRLLSGSVGMVIAETSPMASEPRIAIELLPVHVGAFFSRPGHALVGRRKLLLREVLQYPLVSARLPERIAAHFRDVPAAMMLDHVTGDFLPRITTTSFATARTLVLRTDGVGLATQSSVADDVRSGTLHILDVQSAELQTQYGIARLRDRTASPVELAFMQHVRDVESEILAAPSRLVGRKAGQRKLERRRRKAR